MEIKGKLIEKGETKSFGEKDFKVAKFFIDLTTFNSQTGQEYPNKAEFQVTGTKISELDVCNVGDTLMVSFQIEGREVAKKDGSGNMFIQNLKAFKIVVEQKAEQPNEKLPF